ncbi:MAG: hypothetical protein ABI277_05575 [Burkholderiaceae bacterium]
MNFLDILKQYTNPSAAPATDVENHFDQVAQQAPPQALGRGIAAALRSDATPPFGQAVGNLFGQSNPQQQAGLLNELIQSIGPGAISGVAGGVLGRFFGASTGGGATPTVTSAQASQLSPSDVNAIAAHAEQRDPSVIDRVGTFYAEHPTLVKTLGAVALSAVMGHLSARR